MRKAVRIAVMTLLVAAGVALDAPSASALAPGGGSLALEVGADLPTFPCAPPAVCTGTFSGTISGELAGVENLNPWWAHVVLAPVSGSFTYSDMTVNCALGQASGTGSVSVGDPNTYGAYGAVPTPEGVTGFQLTFAFLYERYGVDAVLTVSNVNVNINTTTSGWRRVLTNGFGNGAAQFAPIFSPLLDTPDCVNFTHTSHATAVVAGDVIVAAA